MNIEASPHLSWQTLRYLCTKLLKSMVHQFLNQTPEGKCFSHLGVETSWKKLFSLSWASKLFSKLSIAVNNIIKGLRNVQSYESFLEASKQYENQNKSSHWSFSSSEAISGNCFKKIYVFNGNSLKYLKDICILGKILRIQQSQGNSSVSKITEHELCIIPLSLNVLLRIFLLNISLTSQESGCRKRFSKEIFSTLSFETLKKILRKVESFNLKHELCHIQKVQFTLT